MFKFQKSGETIDGIVVHKPPVGIVQRHEGGFIEWAPGNGCAYQLVVCLLPTLIQAMIGGAVMISVRSRKGNFYTSYAGNPSGVYTLDFVEEKFGEERDSLYYVTALINWAIYGDDSVGGGYAQSMYYEAREKWKA